MLNRTAGLWVMDAVDKKLLTVVQSGFPLSARPYREIGEVLGLSEAETLERLRRLSESGFIRKLGVFLDPRKLGYTGTLCAFKVPPERVPQVASIVNNCSEVTHNYLREHRYNMWFTLITRSTQAASNRLDELARRSGVEYWLNLPAVRLYKIRVVFNLDGGSMPSPAPVVLPEMPRAERLSGEDRSLIRVIQDPLTLEENPFAPVAAKLGWSETNILRGIKSLLDRGIIRRLGAALRHRHIGMVANAMAVWQVPEADAPRVGNLLAASPHVSHCYQRLAPPEFPFNLYAMIHGENRDFCEEVADRLSREAGISGYQLLFSNAELKKSSMRYLTEGEAAVE